MAMLAQKCVVVHTKDEGGEAAARGGGNGNGNGNGSGSGSGKGNGALPRGPGVDLCFASKEEALGAAAKLRRLVGLTSTDRSREQGDASRASAGGTMNGGGLFPGSQEGTSGELRLNTLVSDERGAGSVSDVTSPHGAAGVHSTSSSSGALDGGASTLVSLRRGSHALPTPGTTPGHAIDLEGLFAVQSPRESVGGGRSTGAVGEGEGGGDGDGSSGVRGEHLYAVKEQEMGQVGYTGGGGLGGHAPAHAHAPTPTPAPPVQPPSPVPHSGSSGSFDASKPMPPGSTKAELRLVHGVLRDVIMSIPKETPDDELPTYRDLRKALEQQLQRAYSTKAWREWLRAQVDAIFAEVDEMDAAGM